MNELVYLPMWAMYAIPSGTFVLGVIVALFLWRPKPKTTPIYEVTKNTLGADVKAAKPGEGKATTKRIKSYQRIK